MGAGSSIKLSSKLGSICPPGTPKGPIPRFALNVSAPGIIKGLALPIFLTYHHPMRDDNLNGASELVEVVDALEAPPMKVMKPKAPYKKPKTKKKAKPKKPTKTKAAAKTKKGIVAKRPKALGKTGPKGRKYPRRDGDTVYGAKVKKARQKKGLSQAALGLKVARTQATISNIETGTANASPGLKAAFKKCLGL